MAEKVSSKAWSKFKDSDFTDEQYAKAAALDKGTGSGKARYALPIREPDGTLNKNAVHAAAGRIASVEGATDEQKKAAAKTISAAYAAMGETPPKALKELAGGGASGSPKGDSSKPGSASTEDMADTMTARFAEGDFVRVKYRFGSEGMQGRIKSVVTSGEVNGINEDFKITGTEESPAAEVEIYYQGEPSGKVIGFKTSMLQKSYMEDYSEDDADNSETEDLDENSEDAEAVQTPFNFGTAERLGRQLWRKQVAPFRKIKARGKVFAFDEKKADGVIASHEGGAFDQVPLVLGHTNNPEMGRGLIKGFIKTKTGLDALIETDSRGTAMVENNENLGVSVGIIENYTRESDGKKFGPTIQHVAATYMPRMTGMSGWKAVNLGEDLRTRLELDFSDEDMEVLDLTGSGWETTEDLSDGPDVGTEETDGADGANTTELTEDDRAYIAQVMGENGLLPEEGADDVQLDEETDETDDTEGDELSAEEKTAYEDRISNLEQRLRQQEVEAYLDECMHEGVPKADIDIARPVLLSASSDTEFEYVELSEDGAETKKATSSTQMRAMLESRKGTVEMGERGADDAKNDAEKSDDEKVREYIAAEKEKGTELSYDVAATHLAERGEIRIG